MTNSPLTYITASRADARRGLIRGAVQANMAAARQWRLDNPEFFAADPAALPQRGKPGTKAPARTGAA